MRRIPRLAVGAFALGCMFISSTAFSQGTCGDLNRTLFPYYVGRATNNVYICDGANFQNLLTTKASPLELGIGTTSPGAGLDVQSGITSAGGVAYGGRFQQILTASADGDLLTALLISPTFNNGSFSGVTNNGLVVASGNVGIGTATPVTQFSNNGNNTGDASGNGETSTSINWAANAPGYVEALYNLNNTANGNGLLIKGGGNTTNSLLSIDYGTGQATSGTALLRVLGNGNVGIGSTGPVASLDLSQKTDAIALPSGTTGQRPSSPVNGMIRYNSTSTPTVEAYVNGAWASLTGSGGSSTITLGTSASATNPQRSGDPTTGMFSDAASTVEVAAAGTKVLSIANTGILNIALAPAPGSYQGSLQLNGNNAAWQDATNYNLALGPTAFPATVSQAGGGGLGQANTALGYQALNANTTGYSNTAIGVTALANNTAGHENVAVGANAMNQAIGAGNVAVGNYALSSNYPGNGSYNVAVGLKAMAYNTSGSNNVAVGEQALSGDSSGNNNTGVGYGALYNNTTGNNNTAMGYLAGLDLTTGGQNIIIGYYPTTGVGITTGSNNILIGQNLQALTQTGSNQLDIGNLIFATGLGSGATLSTGNVGIGSSGPVASLDLSQKTDALALPTGTTGQRPGSPVNGMMRYNSTVPQVEAYYGGAWNALGGGGAGGGGITAPVTVPIRVITASGAVTVSATTDYYICVNKTTGAPTTVNLPAGPATGLMYIIKDCKGDAATNNITVTPASGSVDGASTFVMSTNYQAIGVIYNGTQWNTQ